MTDIHSAVMVLTEDGLNNAPADYAEFVTAAIIIFKKRILR